METCRLMKQFDSDLELHTNTESCFGRKEDNELAKFIPRQFLTTYWGEDNLYDLLGSLPGPGFVPHEISQILGEYIVVFSILTKLHKPDQIRKFLDLQIKDSSLPLHDLSMPKSWTNQLHNTVLWNSFISEQWLFCPFIFGKSFDAELPESCIFPIQTKDFLQDKPHDGDLAILYKVKIHPAYRSELSVSQRSR